MSTIDRYRDRFTSGRERRRKRGNSGENYGGHHDSIRAHVIFPRQNAMFS